MPAIIRLKDDSRPSLFQAIAEMIERFQPHCPANTVLGNTRVNANIRMQIQMLFRQEGILQPHEFIAGDSPDTLIESYETLKKKRVGERTQ